MPNPIHPTQYYTYYRVSHAERESGSASLAWQEECVQGWLKEHEPFEAHAFFDDGVSGGVPLAERPDGLRMLKALVLNSGVVVVARLDRLFRDVEDFRGRIREWCEHDVRLVSVTESFDLTTPSGRMIATIIAAVSEYERELIGQRTREIRETRRAKGLRVTAEAPYGWKYVPFGEKRTDGSREHRIEPDPAEQGVILLIAQQRGEGKTLQAIADLLYRIRHPTRRGGRWSVSTVAEILKGIDKRMAMPPMPSELIDAGPELPMDERDEEEPPT